jgi:hypothetical protein
MARALISPVAVTRAGVAPPAETTGDPVNFHYVPNDGATYLLVRNSNGASTARVLTVRVATLIDGQAVASRTYSIAAGASRYIGPFDVATYGTQLLLDPDNAELRMSALQMS